MELLAALGIIVASYFTQEYVEKKIMTAAIKEGATAATSALGLSGVKGSLAGMADKLSGFFGGHKATEIANPENQQEVQDTLTEVDNGDQETGTSPADDDTMG